MASQQALAATSRLFTSQRMESVGKRRCSHDGRLASYLLSQSNAAIGGLASTCATTMGQPSVVSHPSATAESPVDGQPTTPSGAMRSLELEGVIRLLKMYDDVTGPEIVCCICGKPYKSKVCFTKHVWEHSVYWDKFEGFKNHERVLSIQAAIILTHAEDLAFLLVTGPNIDKKQQRENGPSPVPEGNVSATEVSPTTPPQSSPSESLTSSSGSSLRQESRSKSALSFLPKKRRRLEFEVQQEQAGSSSSIDTPISPVPLE